MKIRKFLRLQRDLGFTFPEGSDVDDPADAPADFDLRLPSDLSSHDRLRWYPTTVVQIEEELLEAAVREALEAVRSTLRARNGFLKFRATNVAGVTNSTRAARLMNSLQKETDVAVCNYRAHRESLLALRGPGEWEEEL
jgi:hypothetical protein